MQMKIIILIILTSINLSKLNEIERVFIFFDGYSCISCQPGVIYSFENLNELGLGDKIVLVNKQKSKRIKNYNLNLIKEYSTKFKLMNITEDTSYTNNMDYFKPILIKRKGQNDLIIKRNEVPYTKEEWIKLFQSKKIL